MTWRVGWPAARQDGRGRVGETGSSSVQRSADEWVSREWNWREDSNREVKNSTTGDRERRKSKRIHFAPVLQVLQLHCTPRARCVRR